MNHLGIRVTDHISAMIAYWDKDTICRFANSAYVDWFGKKKEDMVNKMTIKELLGPLYEKNLPYISAALKGEAQTFEREIPLPTGGVRHSLANYYPDIVNGEVLGFFVHVADVTPLKVLEKELIASTKKINEQNNRLLNFSNIVSHNLKSYANNLASTIVLYEKAKSEEERNKMFGYISKISEGFGTTVNHLNEITRSQNLSKIKPEKINLYSFIEKAKETLLIQIESTNAIINNTVSKDIEFVANPAYIESIILNLLTNALKYRQPSQTPLIDFSCIKEPKRFIFKITDNGRGINLERHRDEIFGMYKTFHGNADAEGIGLFITKDQIDAMGAEIEIESLENKGTTFTIYFNVEN
ncbi:MAG: domain S-box protein [Bacteroidota bacterium]|nr:domain S-box protein [Bacteroidota bacterium]